MSMCHPGEKERLVADLQPTTQAMLDRPNSRDKLVEFLSHLKLKLRQSTPPGKKEEEALPLPGIEGGSPVEIMMTESRTRERKVRESLTFMAAHLCPGSL